MSNSAAIRLRRSCGVLARWIRFIARGLYFGAYRGANGYGFPKPRAEWEEEYQRGHWNYLFEGKERPNQMVVLGYVMQHHPSPSVLDVGCGEGVLFSMLQRFPLAEYHGVDVSEEAIARVRSRAHSASNAMGPPRVVLSRADFETFNPPRRYDVIVFNNSLMYADDPLWVLERFANHLAPEGIIVASMCYNRWQFPIWKRIAGRFRTVHAAEVTNEDGLLWHVRTLHRRAEGVGSSYGEDRGASAWDGSVVSGGIARFVRSRTSGLRP